MSTILVTGSSGFIGFHLSKSLLEKGHTVVGIDNENDYYDVSLKQLRREKLKEHSEFYFEFGDLADNAFLADVFEKYTIDKVCNLAAQAGVRYSIENPSAYVRANLVGFCNLIELAKNNNIQNFVYASSSSVYGKNEKQPLSVEDRVDTPISLYAATKKSNELIAHVYTHLFGLPTVGLRFFTVYGPRGRPDMAMYKFAERILQDRPIDVYNHGEMRRDFTYIDDIVSGIMKSLELSSHTYEIFNLGNDSPVKLIDMIEMLEKELGKTAEKNFMGMQPGDVQKTYADIDHTRKLLDWAPEVFVEEGINKFIARFKEYTS